jgi:uncharacterized C2H2 Zn-finger protein
VGDNFVNCGMLDAPVKSEAEPEVLIEVVSLATNAKNTNNSKLLRSTSSQEAAIGQYVLIDQESDMLRSRTMDASIPVRTSSKTNQSASKRPLKAKYNTRNDNSRPTHVACSVKKPKIAISAKPDLNKDSEVISKHKLITKKRIDKATIADLKKLPELLSAPSYVKMAKANPSLQVSWGKKKVYLNYSCNLCGYEFVTPSKLARHMTSHKRDLYRRFNCNECGKWFIRKDYLMSHISKIHLSVTNSKVACEGSIKCIHCPTVFKSKSRMTYHIKTNHASMQP